MSFENVCTDFITTIAQRKNEEIERKVAEQLQKDYVPYKEQLDELRNKSVAEEKVNASKNIEAIRDGLNKAIEDLKLKADLKIKEVQETCDNKVNKFIADAEKAENERKQRVENAVREKTAAKYDKFITGFGQLVDETNIDN